MSQPVEYDLKDSYGRKIYSLHAPSAAELPEFSLPSRYFACFIAGDVQGVSDEDLSRLSSLLLDKGAAYFSVWGGDCYRLHNIIDETIIQRGGQEGMETYQIMTSWHQDESLSEALSFIFNSAEPDVIYIHECKATLVLTIGKEDYDRQVRELLNEPSGELIWG